MTHIHHKNFLSYSIGKHKPNFYMNQVHSIFHYFENAFVIVYLTEL